MIFYEKERRKNRVSGQTWIVYRQDQKSGMIKGFVNSTNLTKNLVKPVPMDVTTDYVACSLQSALRESFKDEIFQMAVVQKKQQQTQGGTQQQQVWPLPNFVF